MAVYVAVFVALDVLAVAAAAAAAVDAAVEGLVVGVVEKEGWAWRVVWGRKVCRLEDCRMEEWKDGSADAGASDDAGACSWGWVLTGVWWWVVGNSRFRYNSSRFGNSFLSESLGPQT